MNFYLSAERKANENSSKICSKSRKFVNVGGILKMKMICENKQIAEMKGLSFLNSHGGLFKNFRIAHALIIWKPWPNMSRKLWNDSSLGKGGEIRTRKRMDIEIGDERKRFVKLAGGGKFREKKRRKGFLIGNLESEIFST